MIRTSHFHCRVMGSIPGRETKILDATRRGQKKKKKKERGTPGRLIHKEKAVSYEDTGKGSHLQTGKSDLRRNLPTP